VPVWSPGDALKQLPPQQSALMVQLPLSATHVVTAHRKVLVPVPSSTHGFWLQQSADVMQMAPAGAQMVSRMQRGMPSESGWQHRSGLLLQVPWFGMLSGSQQLLATLHAVELEPVLQISPGFEHELPLPHWPN
jgi:hypothetical protein